MAEIKSKGIDISKWQSSFNLSQVPDTVEFIILRLGYRGWGTGRLVMDETFSSRYREIKKSSKMLGAYFFSQAINYDEGVQEAEFCLKNCDKENFPYGIWFDSEIGHIDEKTHEAVGRADHISNVDRTAAAKGFMDVMRRNGVRTGIYASSSWFGSRLNMDSIPNTEVWTADYRGYCGYTRNMIMWQYTSGGSVPGIPGRIDMNYCYIDIEGQKPNPEPTPDIPPEPCFKIGPASKGDRKSLVNLAKNLQLGYKDDGVYVFIGPMSKGDKLTVYNEADSLGLPIEGCEVIPSDKTEKLIWDMDYLRITQKYGFEVDGIAPDTYSHAMTNALDMGGENAYRDDYVRAPFTCVVKKIYPSYNTVFIESIGEVERRDGKKSYLTMQLTHINDLDKDGLGIKEGAIFRQGEVCYREGRKGASGAHVHVAIGEGKFYGNGWDRQPNGNNRIHNPLYLHKVAWLENSTKVLDGGGYEWYYEDGRVHKGDSNPKPIPPVPVSNKKRYAKVKPGSWNIRKDSNTNSPSVGILKGGSFEEFTAKKDGWYKISRGYIGPAAVSGDTYTKLKTGRWSVRSGPNTSYPRIDVITGNKIIYFEAIEDGWYRMSKGRYVGPAAVEDRK